MNENKLTLNEIKEYNKNGYLIVKRFCDKREVEKLYKLCIEDKTFDENAIELNDKGGKKTKLSLWYTPGNNPFGYLSRSEKIINRVSQLLGDEAAVCHYHSKLMHKEPRQGGAWEWHQDYGYWYKNQFMYPDKMMSVMIAVSEATKENGCLQVIKGSHLLGRVNHRFSGEQVGADEVMVNNALKTMELVYCELEAGDALFFHSNILHRSGQNLSAKSRWSIISCYSAQDNIAYNEPSSAWKTPVNVVPDEAVLSWPSDDAVESDYLQKENDEALKDTGWESNT
ncbi:phytanoyl-CoA dioxygenase family protein [Parafilimonas sp.]|uniref:phytanoyl-CoA dioxygenase family protein n=1 Tax=Parafilimonas sp. TaxID=1969739 RepID=UPI0039E640B6